MTVVGARCTDTRANEGTGTHKEHASQHRPTTHPPLGVPLHLAVLLRRESVISGEGMLCTVREIALVAI